VAWVIYRIQTQTGINPLNPRRDGRGERNGGKGGAEMMEGGKKRSFMIAGKINTSLSCYNNIRYNLIYCNIILDTISCTVI